MNVQVRDRLKLEPVASRAAPNGSQRLPKLFRPINGEDIPCALDTKLIDTGGSASLQRL